MLSMAFAEARPSDLDECSDAASSQFFTSPRMDSRLLISARTSTVAESLANGRGSTLVEMYRCWVAELGTFLSNFLVIFTNPRRLISPNHWRFLSWLLSSAEPP